MNHQLREAASWKLVSEFLRRYPRMFRLIETHPGGGQYDCLTVVDSEGSVVADFNRAGNLHIWKSQKGRRDSPQSLDIWDRVLSAEDPKEVLDTISRELGLPIPRRLPASSDSVVVYRFVAVLLAQAVFGRSRWECRNGFFDSSGEESGVLSYFDSYPAAQDRLGKRLRSDIEGQPAYRFWFVLRNDEPAVCLENTGSAWLADGRAFDLVQLYGQERRIWPVVHAVAGDLLP